MQCKKFLFLEPMDSLSCLEHRQPAYFLSLTQNHEQIQCAIDCAQNSNTIQVDELTRLINQYIQSNQLDELRKQEQKTMKTVINFIRLRVTAYIDDFILKTTKIQQKILTKIDRLYHKLHHEFEDPILAVIERYENEKLTPQSAVQFAKEIRVHLSKDSKNTWIFDDFMKSHQRVLSMTENDLNKANEIDYLVRWNIVQIQPFDSAQDIEMTLIQASKSSNITLMKSIIYHLWQKYNTVSIHQLNLNQLFEVIEEVVKAEVATKNLEDHQISRLKNSLLASMKQLIYLIQYFNTHELNLINLSQGKYSLRLHFYEEVVGKQPILQQLLRLIIKTTSVSQNLIKFASNAAYLLNRLKTVFINENFSGICIRNTNLQGADFEGANLQHSHFEHVNISGCDFSSVNMKGVTWTNLVSDEIMVINQYDIKQVKISPDGIVIACGSGDWTIRLWNLQTGKEHKKLAGHLDAVCSVAFSFDGQFLVSGSHDKTICIWNTATGKELKRLTGHTDAVRCAVFSPNAISIASGSCDQTIRVWNAESGKELKRMTAHKASVCSIVYSTDGKLLASAGLDAVRIWNAETGKEVRVIEDSSKSPQAIFSPNGRLIASISDDQTIRIWCTESGDELKALIGHISPVQSIDFSPDDEFLVSGSSDSSLRFWSVETGLEVRQLLGHSDSIKSVSYSQNGKFIVSGSEDKTIRIWSAMQDDIVKPLHGHLDAVRTVAFSPNGQQLLSGSRDQTIRVWNVETGEELFASNCNSNYVLQAAYSPDGKLIATEGFSNIILLDSKSGKRVKTLQGHRDLVYSVSFSKDGSLIASGSKDCTIRIWKVDSGKEIKELVGHTDAVRAVVFSPDGRHLASGSQYRNIRIWSVDTGKEVRKLIGHQEAISSIACSPDGQFLVTGSHDKTLRVWNFSTGDQVMSMVGHSQAVNSLSISPDGRLVASGSYDQTVRLWFLGSGKELKKINGHTSGVLSVAFSPDGKLLASGSLDKTIRIWNLESDVDECKVRLQGSQSLDEQEVQLSVNSTLPDSYSSEIESQSCGDQICKLKIRANTIRANRTLLNQDSKLKAGVLELNSVFFEKGAIIK